MCCSNWHHRVLRTETHNTIDTPWPRRAFGLVSVLLSLLVLIRRSLSPSLETKAEKDHTDLPTARMLLASFESKLAPGGEVYS